MPAERARLARLRRLEKLRAAARSAALAEAGEAEARLASLDDLAQRTAALVDAYATRRDAENGADLMRQQAYCTRLQRMLAETHGQAARARSTADARAADAANAERRRAAVADRVAATAARMARSAAAAALPLGARSTARRED